MVWERAIALVGWAKLVVYYIYVAPGYIWTNSVNPTPNPLDYLQTLKFWLPFVGVYYLPRRRRRRRSLRVNPIGANL